MKEQCDLLLVLRDMMSLCVDPIVNWLSKEKMRLAPRQDAIGVNDVIDFVEYRIRDFFMQ